MSGPLIGRWVEVAALEGFVQRLPDGPACLILIGEPGIGKTTLWESAVEDVRRVGCKALVHRAMEAEAALSFTGLADLISPVFEQVSGFLPAPQRRALEVALLLAEPGDDMPGDQRAVGVALLNLLQALSARQPVVLAIDDLQWLDPSTAAVLGIALRRLYAEPIRLLATVRRESGVEIPLDLERHFREGHLEKLTVGPFSLGDLHRLLRDRLSLELTPPELSRVWESAGGNPYFSLELGRELVRTNTRPEVGRNLQPTQNLRDLLVKRLATLPPATLDVLLFAASLAQPSVELVARAYGDTSRAFEALEEGRREGLIGFADGRVRFAHPLLASVCYEEASPWRRRSVHRQLSNSVSDLEERARHLALSLEDADEGVASDLEIAARRAGDRGATAAGAELSELAVRVTPAGDQLGRRRRRMQAATFHRRSGDLERAESNLKLVLGELPHGLERADVLYALASTGHADETTRERLAQEALNEAASDDVRAAKILGYLMYVHWRLGEVPIAVENARAGLERAQRTGDQHLLAVALARAGVAEDAVLDLTPGLLERGIEIERNLDAPLVYHESPRFTYAMVMLHRDRLSECREILAEVDTAADALGDELARAWVAVYMTALEWYEGRWEQAQEQSRIASELAHQVQNSVLRSNFERYRALLEADLGLLEQARRSAQEGLRWGRLASDEVGVIGNVAALGRIELLAGDLQAAGTYLRDLPDRLLTTGRLGPDSVDVWPDSIETLIRLGELERARTFLDTFVELAPRASRRWVAVEARCSGLMAATVGDFEGALIHLERALSELESVRAYPLDRGRTLLVLGSVRRQAGQKAPARAALKEALAIFDALGGHPWSAWARAELNRISGRPAPSHDLSETEVRVATLASQGLSNQQIASALFMGVSTVERHLSRIYGKLGVRRAELGARLREVQAVQ